MPGQPFVYKRYDPLAETGWIIGTEDKGMRYAVRREETLGTVCMLPYGLRPEEKALAHLLASTPNLVKALKEIAERSDCPKAQALAQDAIYQATYFKD